MAISKLIDYWVQNHDIMNALLISIWVLEDTIKPSVLLAPVKQA